MSGFLQRLVARHTDTPSIQPRVASRFADAGGEPASGGNPHGRLAAARPWAAIPAARHGGWPHPHTSDGADAATPGPAATRVIADETAGPGGMPRSAAVSFAPDLHGAVRTSADQSAGSRVPSPYEQLLAPARRADQATARSLERSSVRAALQEANRAERAHASQDAPLPRLPLAPEVSMRRTAPAQSSAPDVVQVHIGRVEVRAVMPAAERPRAGEGKAAPQPLALDQYLSGNGRR